MICSKCGREVEDSYKFCNICGALLQHNERYILPPLSLLRHNEEISSPSEEYIREVANIINTLFINYRISAHVVKVSCGPVYTRYEIKPDPGVSIRRILGLVDDIKLHLAVEDIIIEAPIPNRSAIGFSIVNPSPSRILLRDLLVSKEFVSSSSVLSICVGQNMIGKSIIADISEMPHLLIGGATGSGKSMFIHSIILGILYKATPQETKIILIDTKSAELSIYNGIPHLLIPVITNYNKASQALKWVCLELKKRYEIFASAQVKNIDAYNTMVSAGKIDCQKWLPKILIIIENVSDILDTAGDAETYLTRLIQYGRIAGIHIVISSSFPCKHNVPMLMKSNLTSKISFHVSSLSDSRVILGKAGAEKLFMHGELLFYPENQAEPIRINSAYISYQEIQRVVAYFRESSSTKTNELNLLKNQKNKEGLLDVDPYFEEAGFFVIENNKASIGILQRKFKISLWRANVIMKQLTDCKVVGEKIGPFSRTVLMTKEEFEQIVAINKISNSDDKDRLTNSKE